MPHYRVDLNGKNFWFNFDGAPKRMGFFTSRFVETPDRASAEHAAVALLRTEGKLQPLILNDRQDSPMVFVDRIEEVQSSDVPNVTPGFVFFDDDHKKDS